MEGDWKAPNTSIAYEYLNELTARDRLEGLQGGMRDPLRYKFDRLLDGLDQRFRARTFDDQGEELTQYWQPLTEGKENRCSTSDHPATVSPEKRRSGLDRRIRAASNSSAGTRDIVDSPPVS
jgi:hypothetical protein